MTSLDPNSFANFDQAKISHIGIALNVDFEKRNLSGDATYTIEVLKDSTPEVVFDTSFLSIQKIVLEENGEPLKFSLDDRHEKFGNALRIQIPSKYQKKNSQFKFIITYSTTESGTALAWMTPLQTTGKQHPFLFSQCQAIHARSLIPCQDSPSVKFKYHGSLTVPSPLVALMSAISNESKPLPDNKILYTFTQDIPIPSYLLAIAVGALEHRKIGPRSTVWAEKEVIELSATEFEDTEKFLSIGEDLTTPYVWGKYDILVLPGSFPYGGMENPCLTFVTPALLSGDKSLVNVVAHEISHSWMGNLVTPSNWQHFWLNEGFTVFLERKILGRMQGEAHRSFLSILGWEELEKSVKLFGEKHPFTQLVPNFENMDPDEAFSSVPYEKGYNLLYYLEEVVGGPSIFEPYLKAHVKKFQSQSITSEDFREFFLEYFKQKPKETLDKIDWKTWFTSPGLPRRPNFDQTLAKACSTLSERWVKSKENNFKKEDYSTLNPTQKVVFLTNLETKTPLPTEDIEKMDTIYNISSETNPEIKFHWQMVALLSNYQPIFTDVVTFLGIHGRMKYIRPLYRSLNQCSRDLALKTFQQNKSFYHPIAVKQITSDLKIESK